MKQLRNHILILVISAVAVGAGLNGAAAGTIPNQIVMKLAPGQTSDGILQNHFMNMRDSVVTQRLYLAEVSPGGSLEDIITELSLDPSVVYAEPNYAVELPENFQMSQSFPDDDVPPLLEGVEPTAFYKQPVTYSLGIDEAQMQSTGSGITIAVIDNGVDFDHPLLAPRLLSTGFDFLDNDADPGYEAGSVPSHGTFVSGLIVRTAPDASLLPLRSFNSEGIGNSFAIASAIYYSVVQNARVVNMSFGMFDSCQVMDRAIQFAARNGLSLVAASGNNSLSQPVYPAAYKNVIAISGIDQYDLLAPFSNYGEYIDICAPAVDLYSCLAGPDYDWGTWSGTSFAAPFVTATCAMVLALNPDLNAGAMEFLIRGTATVQLLWGTVEPPDDQYGYGRLDIANAVNAATVSQHGGPADMNGNGSVDVADVAYLAGHIQGNGPRPSPKANPDLNCDGVVDLEDVYFILDFLFNEGPDPEPCP